MRTLAVSLALVLGSVAFASFDLMLLGDNTTAGAQRVMRYDPVNRVVLGSFGSGFIGGDITSIAVDQVGGRAFVATGGLVKVFNYNTGAFLDAFSSSYGDIEYDAGLNRLTVANGTGSGSDPVRVYDGSTYTELATLTDRYYSTAAIRRPGTSWYASFGLPANAATVNAIRNSLAGGSPLPFDAIGPSWSSTNAPRAAIFTNTNQFMGISADNSTNTTKLWTVDTDTSGFVGGLGVWGSMGAYAANANIANGHGSLAYLLMGTNLVTYHTGLQTVLGTQSLGFSSNIRGMAVVIAPEPGTMIALAAGVGALLRRRRRS
ncbi:MAG: PEP-CTERM sorting domain-containing protein [Fimbriimonadaceae bacterium]|nr:PEP-CTERM sorting domain-containing protein [Fimbriimonadaceae bacterium]